MFKKSIFLKTITKAAFVMSCQTRFIMFILLLSHHVFGQTDSGSTKNEVLNVDDRMLNAIQKKYGIIEKKLSLQSKKYLDRLKKEEASINNLISKKDSSSAKKIAANTKEKYNHLLLSIKNISANVDKSPIKAYVPSLDSISATFRFLEKSGIGLSGISTEQFSRIRAISGQLKNLQDIILSGESIKQFVKDRESQLRTELDKYGLSHRIKGFNKQAYYYQQQFNEYKMMISDQKKMEEKLLSFVNKIPSFKKFMEQNSQLSQLFRLPTSANAQSVSPGLQSRASIQNDLNGRLGSVTDPQQFVNQQTQLAQTEISKLKDKINQLGGGSSDMIIPDFQPNKQRTKSFLRRIELGLNIQSQSAGPVLPAVSDISISAGYKLNDKSTIGIGAGYKLGLGRGLNNIRFSSQGLSLRSFLDIKLKGSIWISGGYEENYFHAFTNIYQLKDRSAWQESGLIGLMKKYRIAKKEGNLQLLWDFLSYSQVPRSVPLKFRIGYNF